MYNPTEVEIKINCGSPDEAARILREFADRVETMARPPLGNWVEDNWIPRDINGNQVGNAWVYLKDSTPYAIGRSSWASYLINGDASGLDKVELAAARRFESSLSGNIFTCSEGSFFYTPFTDVKAGPGDCVLYYYTLD